MKKEDFIYVGIAITIIVVMIWYGFFYDRTIKVVNEEVTEEAAMAGTLCINDVRKYTLVAKFSDGNEIEYNLPITWSYTKVENDQLYVVYKDENDELQSMWICNDPGRGYKIMVTYTKQVED